MTSDKKGYIIRGTEVDFTFNPLYERKLGINLKYKIKDNLLMTILPK